MEDGGDKMEDGGDRKKEGYRAKRGRADDFAFSGRVIRLTGQDYSQWKRTYHSIPDFEAELTSLDAWLDGQTDEKRGKWFHTVSGALNRKHQELRSEGRHAGKECVNTCRSRWSP